MSVTECKPKRKNFKDLTGQTRNGYVVLSWSHRNEFGNQQWNVRCIRCGKEHVRSSNAINGNKRGGCCDSHPKTHGMSRTTTYRTWISMVQRCTDTNTPSYPDYGGKGISVCDRWRNSFETFYADMGERPTGKTLDRYPNGKGNYEPGNCRWATVKEQNLNRCTTRLITAFGKTQSMSEWSKATGIPSQTISMRANKMLHLTPEQIVSAPPRSLGTGRKPKLQYHKISQE